MKLILIGIISIILTACTAPLVVTGLPTLLPSPTTQMYRVTAHILNVRECPSITCDIVGTLKQDEVVQIFEYATADDGGRWARIAPDLWVSTRYLK